MSKGTVCRVVVHIIFLYFCSKTLTLVLVKNPGRIENLFETNIRKYYNFSNTIVFLTAKKQQTVQ